MSHKQPYQPPTPPLRVRSDGGTSPRVSGRHKGPPSSVRRDRSLPKDAEQKKGRDWSETNVNGLYVIDGRIGGGSFSDCYVGRETGTGAPVAFKIEDVQKIRGVSRLGGEHAILDFLATGTSISARLVPQPLLYTRLDDGCSVLVQELLGPSLGDLLKLCGGKFSVHTAACIAIQVIDCLKYVHEKGYIHRDVKPQNFLIGRNRESSKIFICDFGLAKRRSYRAIPRTGGKPAGTIRYVSLNAHKGIEQTLRDDMEAVGYMLVHMIRGKLPWHDEPVKTTDKRKRHDHIADWKDKHSVADMCEGCPQAVEMFMHLTRSLKYDETPDYRMYSDLFARLRDQHGGKNLEKLDWKRTGVYQGGSGMASPLGKLRTAGQQPQSQPQPQQHVRNVASVSASDSTSLEEVRDSSSPYSPSATTPPMGFTPGTKVLAMFAGSYHPATIHSILRNGTYVVFWADGSYTNGVLPGDIQSVSRTPSKLYSPGDTVSAVFRGEVYPATIFSVDHESLTYTICWEDGSHSTGVSPQHIRTH
eukprot:TRINITY_DN9479_c1_g1_i1.p1 TRINITY_DN9479_c1_g1~~TRINITY_DN9479_c1_g1_i1.p1  ORF type:complete len:550 (+),score=5.87 TRINITY_DN9479_c1_g1_i1:65-1651(+)